MLSLRLGWMCTPLTPVDAALLSWLLHVVMSR
jgi:hypothetical protein